MKAKSYLEGCALALALIGHAWAEDKPLIVPDVSVISKQLDAARNALNPDIGASTYVMDADSINDLPMGANTDFNRVLFQAPGAAQNSLGQVHIRGEHANLQYRINGILLPEGISGFGNAVDSRIVDHMALITGTLPAQYGYRTAGVVDIHTKSGAFEDGGEAEFQVGTQATLQPSLTYAGHQGAWNYFVSGHLMASDAGIEPPTSKTNPLHDSTDQGKGFGYFSYIVNPFNRVDVIVGSSVNRFEIPNNPGQDSTYQVNGLSTIESAKLKESQVEQSHYATVAWQGDQGDYFYQMAPYVRWTQTHFHPDVVGDLQYNGIAADVLRADVAAGLQFDGGWKVNDVHTLRAGLVFQHDTASANNSSTVFSGAFDGSGTMQQSSTTPYLITDNSTKEGIMAGVYVQDEWHLSDRLTLNYGLRFDQVNAFVEENQVSPRAGLVYQATLETTLHAGYARTFTPPPIELVAPNSLNKFRGTTAESAVQQDDQVRSERSHSFDAGIIQRVGEHLQFGLDSYAKLVTNLLDEGQFGSALVFTPLNYQEGRVYGLEGTMSYSDKTTSAYANVAVSRAMGKKIVSSQFALSQDELDFIAKHWVHLDHDQLVTMSAGLAQSLDELTRVSLDGILGSGLRKDFANTGHMPMYTQLDVGITHHVPFDREGMDLRLAVLNLLDIPYQINDGTGISTAAAHWGPRRSVFFTMTRRF